MNKSFKTVSLKNINKNLLIFFFITFPLILVSSYYVVQYTMDNNLKQNAAIVLSVANHELGEIEESGHLKTLGGEDVLFQVFVDDKITIHSKNAPNFKVFKGEGIETVKVDFFYWRVFHFSENGVSLYVGEKIAKRYYIVYWTLLIVAILYVMFYVLLRFFLNKTVNKIIEELKLNVKELYDNNDVETFTELTPVINKIQKYKKQLEAHINKEREFLEHVSHELRTPLAIMKINIEKENTVSLMDSYEKIERIITQFLIFSKGESGVEKELSIVESITNSIEEVLKIYPEIDFDVDIVNDFKIKANQDLLKLVFNNFLLNSLEKNSKEIKITINEKIVLIEDFCGSLENKIRGYGIGLILVEKILNRLAAKYDIFNNDKNGVTVKIEF